MLFISLYLILNNMISTNNGSLFCVAGTRFSYEIHIYLASIKTAMYANTCLSTTIPIPDSVWDLAESLLHNYQFPSFPCFVVPRKLQCHVCSTVECFFRWLPHKAVFLLHLWTWLMPTISCLIALIPSLVVLLVSDGTRRSA